MRRFEFSDGHSNKFWEITTSETELTVRFGKIGTGGTRQTKSFETAAAAAAEAERLMKEKLRKGYREIPLPPETPAGQGSGGDHTALSAFERGLIADFLAAAAADYLDYSCNDYLVPVSDDNRRVLEAALRHDASDGKLDESSVKVMESYAKVEDGLFIWDFVLMKYLAHRAAGPGQPSSEAERMLIADLLDYLAGNEYQRYASDPGCEDFSLEASPAAKSWLAAIVEFNQREGWQDKCREILAADDVVSVFTTDILHWLAQRCRQAVPPPALEPAAGAGEEAAGGVPKLGVSRNWLSEKSIVKQATQWDESNIPYYRKNDEKLAAYAQGGNPFREFPDSPLACRPPFAFNVSLILGMAGDKHRRGAALALFGKDTSLDAREELARYASYQYWSHQVDLHRHSEIRGEGMVFSLALCLCLGHMPQARLLAVLLHGVVAQSVKDWEKLPPLHRWIASIAFAHWHLEMPPTLVASLKEPVLIELLEHWSDQDLDLFPSHLLWLCDFHTHHFTWPLIAARLPVAILAWFRLRQWAGLANPAIRHPLMKPGYAQLPAARGMHTDPTLEAVIARLRQEELPRLGDLDLQGLPPDVPNFEGAEGGDRYAQHDLALRYEQGRGVDRDDEKALHWYQQSAAQGHADAQYCLGKIYLMGIKAPADRAQARDWLTSAAAQGHDHAREELRTIELWLAAEEGNLRARFDLAYLYQEWRNYSQAEYWYRLAAEQAEVAPCDSPNMFENGSAAECNLANMYEHGLGLPQDYEQALYWYRKSAARNNYVAQYSLGMMYLKGLGVTKDLEEARAWFTRSAQQGYRDASSALGEIQ